MCMSRRKMTEQEKPTQVRESCAANSPGSIGMIGVYIAPD